MKIKRRLNKLTGFDMTPMIDVVFLLIIFFMVSSTFITHRGIKVKLPQSTNSESESKNLLELTVNQFGRVFLNGKEYSDKQLAIELKKQRIEKKQNVVIIKGDKLVPYNRMIKAMDIAKIAGIERVSLATEKGN